MSTTYHFEATIENCLEILKDKNVKIEDMKWGHLLSWDDKLHFSEEIKRHSVEIESHSQAPTHIIDINRGIGMFENGQSKLYDHLVENGFQFLWSD